MRMNFFSNYILAIVGDNFYYGMPYENFIFPCENGDRTIQKFRKTLNAIFSSFCFGNYIGLCNCVHEPLYFFWLLIFELL